MDYAALLKEAWHTLRQKALWPFALLATLAGGCSGVSNTLQILFSPDFQGARYLRRLMPLARRLEAGDPGVVLLLVLFALGLALLLLLAYSFGQAGLVRGITRHAQGESVLRPGAVAQEGQEYWWRLLALNLAFGFLSFIVFLPVVGVAVLIGVATLGLGLLCFFPFFLLLALLLAALQRAVELALLAEERPFFEAFTRGWQVFSARFWPWMGVILSEGVIALITRFPLILPFYFATFLALWGAERGQAALILIAIALLIGYGVFVFWPLTAAVTAYRAAFRTHGYLELAALLPDTPAPSPEAFPSPGGDPAVEV